MARRSPVTPRMMPSTARSRSHWPSGFPVVVGEDLYAGPGRYKAACVDPEIALLVCVCVCVFWGVFCNCLLVQRIGAQYLLGLRGIYILYEVW